MKLKLGDKLPWIVNVTGDPMFPYIRDKDITKLYEYDNKKFYQSRLSDFIDNQNPYIL